MLFSTIIILIVDFFYIDRQRTTKHLFIDPRLKVWRIKYVRAIRQFRNNDNALIAYLDETWLNENYRKKRTWNEPDLSRSQSGPLKFQCAECGDSYPSGSGQRLVIFDVVTKYGFVDGCGLIWKAASKTGDYHGNFNHAIYEKYYFQ